MRETPATTAAIAAVVTSTLAGDLRAAFERELAGEQDFHRRRMLSEALAVGLARVRAERDGQMLSEDLAARHVVAEQMVLGPWRRKLGISAPLAISAEGLDDSELEEFVAAVGVTARPLDGHAPSEP